MFNRAPAACRNNMTENIMMTTCFHAHQYNVDNDAYAFVLIGFFIFISAAFNEVHASSELMKSCSMRQSTISITSENTSIGFKDENTMKAWLQWAKKNNVHYDWSSDQNYP